MGSSDDQSLARRAWQLAAEQHGVIARRQLLELGFGPQAIQHRLSNGRLHRVERGVYVVGRPELTLRGRWSAAVLGCGPQAALSHSSAGALWGVVEVADPIEVSIPMSVRRRRPGVVAHRRPNLTPTDLTVREGIPVTSIVRTLIDLAHRLNRPRLDRAINEADRLDLVDPECLYDALEAYRGQPGVGPLRAILGDRSFRLTDSDLERRFLKLVAEIDLPTPLTQQQLNGFRVDFYWPDLGLAPHARPAGQRLATRSGSHRSRADAVAFYARTGAIRSRARPPDAARGRRPAARGRRPAGRSR
jgi:Transcriptional regulator, AbiEi antitoxin